MFVGRTRELKKLQSLYNSNQFEFAVFYGRRRVGKTTLINEFIKDKKAVGILTEGIVNMEEGGLSQVVIGCGVNLKSKREDFSPELQDIVTSFYPSGESSVNRVDVVAECEKAIIKAQEIDFLEEYRKKCFVIGKDIYVVRMNEKKPAKALKIDKDGHLVVRYNDGSVESLSSGEVSIRF